MSLRQVGGDHYSTAAGRLLTSARAATQLHVIIIRCTLDCLHAVHVCHTVTLYPTRSSRAPGERATEHDIVLLSFWKFSECVCVSE